MKTTVEISDSLLTKAKRLARARKTTLRVVIEEGIQLALARAADPPVYRLPDRSVGGAPVDDALRELIASPWSTWRALAYGERE